MTKKEKTERCQAILKKYDLHEPIIEDYDFLIGVFKGHPEWETKNGVGINKIHVGLAKFGSKCFYITRVDNTMTDISFLQSIRGKNRTDLEKIKYACRAAIEPIIKEFKDSIIYGVTKCEVTNEFLIEGQTDIDHYDLTFIEMFNLWIKNYDVNELVKKINIHQDMCQEYYFTDKEIKEDFVLFHNKHCKLRAVTRHVNQVLLRKKPQ